jgi:hypothetical protein
MNSIFIAIFYLCSIYEGQRNEIILREQCHEYYAKCLKELVIDSDYSVATCIENKKKN